MRCEDGPPPPCRYYHGALRLTLRGFHSCVSLLRQWCLLRLMELSAIVSSAKSCWCYSGVAESASKVAERGLERDHSDGLNHTKTRKREANVKWRSLRPFCFPTEGRCGQLESSGSIHPEHLLVTHARSAQTNTKNGVNKEEKRYHFPPLVQLQTQKYRQ